MSRCLPTSPFRAIATSVGLALLAGSLAGCAGRSLTTTPVVDWSNGAQPPVVAASAADRPVLYTARRDDTLASIAARFNTTPATLAAWNNLPPTARVGPGQVLRVSPPPAASPVDATPVATAQPIGDGGVEQRPIGAAPGSVPTTATLPPTAAGASNVPLKSVPLGTKRPYSDAALAEMTHGDPDATLLPSGPPVATISPSTTMAAPPAAPLPASIAWAWPAAGRPSAAFDARTKGIDVAGKAGDAVLAAAAGKVTFSGTGVLGYGKLVIVQHSPDFLSVYAHNRANLVEEGATVAKGQKIAEMGATESDAVKLHFEIRRDSKPVDPLQYLPPR